jgi:hypothetical protein
MAFLLFCVVVAGYFEADRILTADLHRWRARNCFDKSKVLDLKNIAAVRPESHEPVTPVTVVKNRVPPQTWEPVTEVEQSSKGGLFLIRLIGSLMSKRDDRKPSKPGYLWGTILGVKSLFGSIFTRKESKPIATPKVNTEPPPPPAQKNSVDKSMKKSNSIGMTLDEVSASLEEENKEGRVVSIGVSIGCIAFFCLRT